MARSSFDRIARHLRRKGSRTPVRPGLREDLENLVRRCEKAHSLGEALRHVELSPYMKSLLRVSRADAMADVPAAAAGALAPGC
jgi:hypothetical protein